MGCSFQSRNHKPLNKPYQTVPAKYNSGGTHTATLPVSPRVKMAAISEAGNKRPCNGLNSPVTPNSNASPSMTKGKGTGICNNHWIRTLLTAKSVPPMARRLKNRLCRVSRPAILQQAGTNENNKPFCKWPNNKPTATGRHKTMVCRKA